MLVRYEGPANSFDDEAFDKSARVVFKRYGHVKKWERVAVFGIDGAGWNCYYQEADSSQDAIKHLHCHETAVSDGRLPHSENAERSNAIPAPLGPVC